MFCTFEQNNSGGAFVVDATRGIGHYVVVEANTIEQAVERAESIGLYFDGEGDCSCCGSRWYSPWSEDECSEKPLVYGKDALTYNFGITNWDIVFVHYADGKVLCNKELTDLE